MACRMAIWQSLVSDHGFSGSYQSTKRFLGKVRGIPLFQLPPPSMAVKKETASARFEGEGKERSGEAMISVGFLSESTI